MEWIVLMAAAALAVWLFSSRRSRRSARPMGRVQATNSASLPHDVDRYAEFNPFVKDVLRTQKRAGRVSERQAAAVREIVDEIEAARRDRPFLGQVGQDATIEGEVVKVDYSGKGKNRRGRYVIYASSANIIYEGPANLVGRLGEVRFTATVHQHVFSDAGHCDTIVDNARDVVILKKPSASYRLPTSAPPQS